METYAQSDLACESAGMPAGGMEGAEWSEEETGGFHIERLRIRTRAAADALQKPIGTYVTVECGRIGALDGEEGLLLSHLLAGEIRGMAQRLTGKLPCPDFGVFVAGLGNAALTVDSVGPKTVAGLTATRHLREHERSLYRSIGCSALSAMAPGVLGQTGIETLELLRGAVRYVKPDLVLVVDALSARRCHRLASTVQLSDVGIEPGSGVGNRRSAVTRETMGVPVISLGIPTVVNSAALVYDALREAGIEEIGQPLRDVLENGKQFFVSPGDSDVIIERISGLFADAIGLAFTGIL